MIPSDSPLRLTIQCGRCDGMRAESVVRVAGGVAAEGGALRLAGTLIGPQRGRDMTLPTTVPLIDLAAGAPAAVRADVAVARAVFTEPAYWTPELPNLYRLEARLLNGDTTIASFDRLVGLRRLGIRGRSFWLDGRRWVPRGRACSTACFDPQVLRGLHAAAVIADPTPDTCSAADRTGVAIVARLHDQHDVPLDSSQAAERLAAWTLHPSVVLAVVPLSAPAELAQRIAVSAQALKGTILVGLEADGTQPPPDVPDGLAAVVDCFVVALPRDGLPHDGWRSWRMEKPLVAQRAMAGGDMAEDRRECDRLQAALAAWGLARGATQLPWDWAGYCVS